jgi:protein TonB
MPTPHTQGPEIKNRREALRIAAELYPDELRDAGIGGRVSVWLFIDVDGRVKNTAIHESSGHQKLDDAAEAAARKFRFVPARNHDKVVRVWVFIPMVFGAPK